MAFIWLLFGLIVGSFLNVLIYRVPRGESILLPPSHCPHCQQRLKVPDLVPVLSYVWLKGHCRYCRAAISCRYPLVELLTGGLTWLWWVRIGAGLEGAAILLLTYALVVIALIDLDHLIIPNWLTFPLIVAGIILRTFQGEWSSALLGGLVGGGLLFLVVLVYPKGMGLGDVKFLTMTGVFLGWHKVLATLFLGSILGTLIMVPLLLLKRIDRKTPFPFGPFLVAATLMVIYGWQEVSWLFPKGG